MSTFPRPNRDASQMVWVRAPISGARWQVHRELAPILAWVVGEAERRGYLFDHGPSDVDDDWGYNVRRIAGSSSTTRCCGRKPSALTLNSRSLRNTEPVSATPNAARTTPTSTSSSVPGS